MHVKDVKQARQILENAREEMHALRQRNDLLATGLPLPETIGSDLLGPQDDLAKQRLIRDIRNGGAADEA